MNKTKDPLQILQIWFSSSFPIGSYAYSHGLEAIIDNKLIKSKNDVEEFLSALLFYGTLRNEHIFIKSIYEGKEINDLIKLNEKKYDKIKKVIEENCLREIGEKKIEDKTIVATIVTA